MKHKVLILGSSGLIGHQVYNYLKGNCNYELINFSNTHKLNKKTILLDATKIDVFLNSIINVNPKFIINCIGTLINESNADPGLAILLNALLPHKLVSVANHINAKLIHMSTDCVFSGDKKQPYFESDYKDGRDVYAKTKGLGEIISNKHLTLRTSVVGPEIKSSGGELFNWFMSQEGVIKGFTNSIWSGVTTLELAKAINWSIENNITGLYHVTNNQSISKYELLSLFKKHTKKPIDIIQKGDFRNNKAFIDTRRLIDYEIPSYDEMILEMTNLISANKLHYPHYSLYETSA